MKVLKFLFVALLLAGATYAGIYYYNGTKKIDCVPIPNSLPVPGSQGYRIWSGPTFRSFEHTDKPICVPEGWQALGQLKSGPGWAVFPHGLTGVIFKQNTFSSQVVHFPNTSFEVTIIYPSGTYSDELGTIRALVENAFSHVGSLFPSLTGNETRPHTVFITAGVAGDTISNDSRVYPDPGPDVTYVVRTPDQWRSHELVIHAAAHLYNRYRRSWMSGSAPARSFPDDDWQELEATWAEAAYTPNDDGRLDRLRYLYNVHTAVQTDNFSLITEAPFNNKEEFESIDRDVIMGQDATEIDDQYGHYVLGPLTMVATEGLLQELAARKSIPAVSVERLITEANKGTYADYVTALEKTLPRAEYDRVLGWMHRGETIPWELVLKAIEYYNKIY